MSIVLSKVAEPYSEALLDLAKSNDSLKETTNDMNVVSQFLANSSDLTKFLGNPLITRDAKKNVVKDDEFHIQDQKHAINQQLVDIIKFRQNKKWLISIVVVSLFATILGLMIWFMSSGVDVMGGWKEILLLMLGGFVGSFAKVIDFWFNNAEDDVKLLEHADD